MNKADKLKAAELALKHGISAEEAELIIQSPYEFIRETTKELDFADNLTNDELDAMNDPAHCLITLVVDLECQLDELMEER